MLKTLLFCLFTITVACGQSLDSLPGPRKHNIHLASGLLHTRQIDNGYTGSNLLFRKTNMAFRLGYGRESEKQILNVSTSFSIGKIEYKGGDLPSDFYYVEVSADYLRKITSRKLFKRENLFYGGLRLSTINQGLTNISQLDNISVYSLHGAYVALHNRLTLDKKRSLHASWFLPAVVYENRLLYNGGATDVTTPDLKNVPSLLATHGDFSYFSVLRNIQFNVAYVTKLNDRIDASLRYKFFYASSDIEAPYHTYSNELTVGLQFHF